MQRSFLSILLATSALSPASAAQTAQVPLSAGDLFQLELAMDPRIAPNGERVVYVRRYADEKDDQWRTSLWIAHLASGEHRPLTTGARNDREPRWSPDGERLAFVSSESGSPQIWVRWMDSGQTARVTNIAEGPRHLAWSPDGKWIAFTAFVEEVPEPFVELPKPPAGAAWAKPPVVIRAIGYRADGAGYLRVGHTQLLLVPSDGGTPRALTAGPFDVQGPLAWTKDGKAILCASNRRPDHELEPNDTELYWVGVDDGKLTALTDRRGPDGEPALSPAGDLVAYVGFDDRRQGYQTRRLYVAPIAGGAPREVSRAFDRDVESPAWSPDGRSILFLFDERGVTKIGRATLAGEVTVVAENVGGQDLGRPYPAGSFTVSTGGAIAFTRTTAERPADVAVLPSSGSMRVVTALNDDLGAQRAFRGAEELVAKSAHDQRAVQAWYLTPPAFDPARKYPLILEIHGGPFANYGPRFSYEMQIYAAAGYVVLYANPRGSTSYGEEFGNLIHHAYPGHDYDDLMACVDGLVAKGFVDARRMYVTGGSGGGLLTAWIVGKNERFAAAVSAKPVIDWLSHALTADAYPYFVKYWFPGMPWEIPDHYFRRSPLSLVGNVKTPTMLLTGEQDWRTPISQAEEYYQALKLRGIDTALVRIPDSSHSLDDRPSQLAAKVLHVLKWFELYGGEPAVKKGDEPAVHRGGEPAIQKGKSSQ